MSEWVERIKLFFNRKVCTVQEFQYACDYAKTVVDANLDGQVSVKEMFATILRYIIMRQKQ